MNGLPRSTWFPIRGNLYSGKSVSIGEIMDLILNYRPDINLWGFYQPGHKTEGDRFGYDLALLDKGQIKTYPFARINDHQVRGRLGYNFNEGAFDIVSKSLESFVIDERPIILVFDELGWLEIDRKGHYKSICKALKRIPADRHVVVIFALNHSLFSKAQSIISNLNGKLSMSELNCPALDDDFEQFVNAVFDSAKNTYY